MSSTPLVSVIVPAYNAERFLAQTLGSVLRQSEARWECIVVDDGSSDDTRLVADSFAERDPRFAVVSIDNGGASAARNAGFRRSSTASTWVTFMDSDDIWRDTALEVLLHRADGPGLIGAHGLADQVDASGAPIQPGAYAAVGRNRLGLRDRRLVPLGLDEPTDFDVLVNGNVLFPPGLVLARREAYLAAGPFDELFQGPEDWDMLIRLSRQGALAFVDEVLLDYRRHDSNLGAQPHVAAMAWEVRCKAYWSSENTPDQQQRAALGWRAYQAHVRSEHARDVRGALWRRDPSLVVTGLLHVVACTLRSWQGGPRPRIERQPLVW